MVFFETLFDISIVIVSHLCFFLFGSLFFKYQLFKDYSLESNVPAILFSSTFMFSCIMFELVIFEILGILQTGTRLITWKISLSLILILLVLIFPYYLCFFFLKNYLPPPFPFALSLFNAVLFSVLFWHLGNPFPIVKEPEQPFYVSIIERGIGRIGVVGVAIMSVLSGIGAVDFPLQNMTSFMRNLKTVQSHIQQAESQYIQNTNKLISHKKRLLKLQKEALNNTNNNNNGIVKIGLPFFARRYRNQSNDQISNLITEIHLLENFNNELFEEVTEFRNEEARIKYSQTPLGKLLDYSGYFFSVYCAWKLVVSAVNVLFNRVSKRDPVTFGFVVLAQYGGIAVDAQFWSQYISFVLVGVLIATSIRGFLKKFLTLFHTYSSSVSVTSTYTGLILGEVMGIYFVSNILLLRMSLPPEYRTMITDVLGDIEFDFYHRWFDFIFIPSALITIAMFLVSAGRKPLINFTSKAKQYD